MDRSQLLFTAVDLFCGPMQNYRKYEGVTCEKDVPYNDLDKKYCNSDFYYKTELIHKAKLPILVNIHGGGFVRGDKSHRRSLCGRYAAEGWFVLNVNYRLSPAYAYPTALEDIFTLLGKLPEYAQKYNLDMTKIVLTGDSAGAYYASHVTAVCTNNALREGLHFPKLPFNIAGLMSFSGVYNIEQAFCKKIPFGITRVIASDLMGVKLKKDYSNFWDFPLAEYFNTSSFVTDAWPKTFLTYAAKDFFVKGQGEMLERILRERGVAVTVDSTTKLFENHCYHLTFFTPASKRCMEKVLKFLAEIAG